MSMNNEPSPIYRQFRFRVLCLSLKGNSFYFIFFFLMAFYCKVFCRILLCCKQQLAVAVQLLTIYICYLWALFGVLSLHHKTQQRLPESCRSFTARRWQCSVSWRTGPSWTGPAWTTSRSEFLQSGRSWETCPTVCPTAGPPWTTHRGCCPRWPRYAQYTVVPGSRSHFSGSAKSLRNSPWREVLISGWWQ